MKRQVSLLPTGLSPELGRLACRHGWRPIGSTQVTVGGTGQQPRQPSNSIANQPTVTYNPVRSAPLFAGATEQ